MTIALASPAGAVGGNLDRTFGGDGRVLTGFGSTNAFANGVAVQADGKIVTAGAADIATGRRFALARYNTDGTLDATFGGGGGKILTRFAEGDADAAAVVLQDDGKIVAAGGGFGRFALARYEVDGTLDATFGGDGKVVTNFESGAFATAVALQADGKIVAAGLLNLDEFALARYDSNGTLDASFGGDGKVTTRFRAGSGYATGVAIQANGKIVAAGVNFGGDYRFALVRYNTDGTLDATFGGDGKVLTRFDTGRAIAEAVAIQANGKIVASGAVFTDTSDRRFALARYDTEGTLDDTFGGGDGKVVTMFGSRDAGANAVAVQGNGKLVAAGFASTGTRTGFALARYDTDGTRDTAFGRGDGKVVTGFAGGNGGAEAVAIQADGKIVAAGLVQTPSSNLVFALARYLPS